MISMHWYDWAGLVGVALTLVAFYLLQAGRLRGDGAFAVLLSLLYAFNLSAFVLEGLWLGISIYGIARGRRLRSSR
jgi:paired small multidrug resistance pump